MRTLRGKRSRLAVALVAVLGLVGSLLVLTAQPAAALDVEPTGLTVFRLTQGDLQTNAGAPTQQYFDLSPTGGPPQCSDGVDNNDAPPLNVGSDGLIDYFKLDEAIFSGTSTGGGGNNIQDTTQNWTPGEWVGKSVWITDGPGTTDPVQGRRIIANTATQLTVGGTLTNTTFSPAAGAGSVYHISTADPQCSGPDDNSELVPGFQPQENVVVVANVAADGSFTIPKNVRASEEDAISLGGIYFPPGYIPDDSGDFDYITARFQPAPQSNVNTPATGQLDIDTGDLNLTIPVRIKLESTPDPTIGGLGNSCFIPSGNNGITLDFTTGTTAPPGPNTPISGSPFDRRTGRYKVVNNSFSVGTAGSCGFLGLGNGAINAQFGLPAPSGANAATFSFQADPRLNHLPVAPTAVAAIADAPFGHLDPEITTLDASDSFDDNEDAILTYAWTQTDGTPVTLMGADTVNPTYAGPPADDTLTFEVVVGSRDEYLCPDPPEDPPLPPECELLYSAPDEVSVTHSYNIAPVADAGPDQGPLSVGVVNLDGTASSDANNDVLAFNWVQTSGPSVVLQGANTATPSFLISSGPATLEFELTVDDGFIGGTDTDTVEIEVIANQDPVADAGPDQLNRKSLQTVTLDATGSTDADDHELDYEWEQISGHAAVLSDPTAGQPTFEVPPAPDFVYPHSLVFELTVDDGFGGVDTDTVEIEVTASQPVVTVPTRDPAPGFSGDTITLSTTVSNPDGGSITYGWTQITGKTTALTGADTANPTFVQPANGANSAACTSGTGTMGPASNNCPRYSVTVTNTDTGLVSAAANLAAWAGSAPGRPVANPVQGGFIKLSGGTFQLDGTASTQAQGRPLDFAWTQTGGDPVVLVGDDTATPTFEAPDTVQTLTFQLVVTDPLNPIISGNNQRTSLPVSTTVRIVEDRVVADAGPDQPNRTAGQTVTLDGSLSTDPNQLPLEYEWTQVSGPPVTLSDPTEVNPTFVVPPVTSPTGHEFEFELEVTNGGAGEDDTDTDTVSIFSVPSNPTVGAPSRNPSGTVHTGTVITLTPGAINNADGTDLEDYTYNWVQTSGVPTPLTGATTRNPTFSVPTQTNGTSACASSTSVTTGCPRYSVTVTYTPTGASSNAANLAAWASSLPGRPTANAGPAQSVPRNELVTLSGSGTQAQGRPLDFAWTQTGGTAVVLEDADTPDPWFISPDEEGTLTFQLITTDPLNPIETGSNQKTSLPSSTTVNVGNQDPIADAGPDQLVQVGSLVTLDGSGSSDPDDDPLEFEWEQLSGPEVLLAGADQVEATFTAPAEASTLVFSLTVRDGLGGEDSDEVIVEAGELDLATIPYLNGEVKAHRAATKFQVWVENVFGPRTLVDISDVDVSITVNGDPVDPGDVVPAKLVSRNIREGRIGKFGFIWNHGQHTLRAGDEVVITACVDIEGDGNDANNCGVITRPDGIIDLAADGSNVRDVRAKYTSIRSKVSLTNVGEVAVPLDFDDLEVTATVNGDPAANQPVKVKPVDKISLLPKVKMVREPRERFETIRYSRLNVQVEWDHGELEVGDEVQITICSTVPGDLDSDVVPEDWEPTSNNNCTTVTRIVIP